MLYIIIALLWTIQLRPILCSLVIDQPDQDEIHYNEYCPKMQHCPEGAHVMCMYYKPHTVAGPRCSNFQNVSISFDVAEKLVDLVNEIRGRIAMGVETGKDNVTLPRAYGMFKLKWDNELATFAQVLANTCTVKNDLCRATKKHPDPGQLVSLVRFSRPEWYPVLHRDEFSIQGLIPAKIEYAAREGYKTWYGQKQFVTSDMVMRVPDYSDPTSQGRGKMYLQLIDGKATHIGCGLSAYVEYVYHGKNTQKMVYNAVHVVCNFSSQPRKNTLAYKTDNPPPRYDAPYSKCGCPEGAEEDDRCLCSWNPSASRSAPTTCDNDVDCKPAVVLLPIFTVEDAPQNLIRRHGPDGNYDQNKFLDTKYGGLGRNNLDFYEAQNPNSFKRDQQLQLGVDPNEEHSLSYVVNSVGSPYFSKRMPFGKSQTSRLKNTNIALNSQNSELISPYPYQDYGSTNPYSRSNNLNYLSYKEDQRSGNSIQPKTFNKMKRRGYALSNNMNSYTNIVKGKPIKLDVAPRKDFSQAQEMVNSYLQVKHKFDQNSRLNKLRPKPIFQNPTFSSIFSNSLNKSLKDAPDVNRYMKNKFHYEDFNGKEQVNTNDIKNLNEEFDNKLMTLLDNLEQEVKHIELGVNEKEIFDAKIRKIYGTVVGKASSSFGSNFPSVSKFSSAKHLSPESDLDDNYLLENIEDPNKRIIDKEMYETENKVSEINSEEQDKYTPQKSLYFRPMPRYQNAIASYEALDTDHNDYRNTFNDLNELKNSVTNKHHVNNMFDETDYRNDDHFRRPKLNRLENSKDIRSQPFIKTLDNHHNQRDRRYKQRFQEENRYKSKYSHKYRDIDTREKDFRNTNYFYDNEKEHRFRQDDEKYLNRIDETRNKYDDVKKEYMPEYNIRDERTNLKKYRDYDYDNGEPLDDERRKFYQEKLDHLERELQNKHLNQLRSDHKTVRARRLLRGRGMQRTRPSQPDSQHFYMPNRARFLRGY